MAPQRTRDDHGQAGVERQAAGRRRMRGNCPHQCKPARVHRSGCAGLVGRVPAERALLHKVMPLLHRRCRSCCHYSMTRVLRWIYALNLLCLSECGWCEAHHCNTAP